MPKDKTLFILGELKGEIRAQTEATKINTAEIKIFNEYMFKSQGASLERDKHYRRVKHGTIASIFMSAAAALKAFALGH